MKTNRPHDEVYYIKAAAGVISQKNLELLRDSIKRFNKSEDATVYIEPLILEGNLEVTKVPDGQTDVVLARKDTLLLVAAMAIFYLIVNVAAMLYMSGSKTIESGEKRPDRVAAGKED